MVLLTIILFSAKFNRAATASFHTRQLETEIPLMRNEITQHYANLEQSFKERFAFPQNFELCRCCSLDMAMNFFFNFMRVVHELEPNCSKRTPKEFREHLMQMDLFDCHKDLAMIMKRTLEEEWGKYDLKTFSEFKHQLGLESLYKIFDKVFKLLSGSYKKFREKAEYSDYCEVIGKKEKTYIIVAQMFQYCLEHVGIKDNPEEHRYTLSLLIGRIPQFYHLQSGYGLSAKLALAKLGVFFYTACGDIGGPYKEVNKALRETVPGKLVGHIGYIMKGFEYVYDTCPDIRAYAGTYWRGMIGVKQKQFEKFRVGDEALWPGFFSCSADREAAEGFLKTASGRMTDSVLFEVVIPRDSRALYVATMSEYPEEKEVVIYPYQRFRIAGLKEGLGRGIVKMELIKNNEERPNKRPRHR